MRNVILLHNKQNVLNIMGTHKKMKIHTKILYTSYTLLNYFKGVVLLIFTPLLRAK